MNVVFSPVGKCIYCLSTNPPLGKEHIIPYGLGGNLILPRSSCRICARITGEDERFCLREMLGTVRIRQRMPTRRPVDGPTTLPIEFVGGDGTRSREEVPVAKYPHHCMGYVFPPPGIMHEDHATDEIRGDVVFLTFEPELRAHRRAGERTLLKIGTFNALKFMRMLAKIAHAHAVAKVGVDAFEPLLPELILRKAKTVSWLVGGDAGRASLAADPSSSHDLFLEHIQTEGPTFLAVSVRLFAFAAMPTYRIIVGPLKR